MSRQASTASAPRSQRNGTWRIGVRAGDRRRSGADLNRRTDAHAGHCTAAPVFPSARAPWNALDKLCNKPCRICVNRLHMDNSLPLLTEINLFNGARRQDGRCELITFILRCNAMHCYQRNDPIQSDRSAACCAASEKPPPDRLH